MSPQSYSQLVSQLAKTWTPLFDFFLGLEGFLFSSSPPEPFVLCWMHLIVHEFLYQLGCAHELAEQIKTVLVFTEIVFVCTFGKRNAWKPPKTSQPGHT